MAGVVPTIVAEGSPRTNPGGSGGSTSITAWEMKRTGEGKCAVSGGVAIAIKYNFSEDRAWYQSKRRGEVVVCVFVRRYRDSVGKQWGICREPVHRVYAEELGAESWTSLEI